MKASNPKVMIECYRLLVARLEQEGPDWNYPIHLGVTEAGGGEDGRIKSAIGIARCSATAWATPSAFSLTEDSPREIEVCRDLLAQIPTLSLEGRSSISSHTSPEMNGTRWNASLPKDFPFEPFRYERRVTPEIELVPGVKCGGEQNRPRGRDARGLLTRLRRRSGPRTM